ncbi:MAG: plastocyanin/azurin family copper-binding protein [Xanthobacteraceae bacterium]
MVIGQTARSALIAAALGAASAPLVAALMLPASAQGAATVVSIANFTFNPPTIRVKAGTTVNWTNSDDIPHGISWTNGGFARSQALDTGDHTAVTFTTPGTYQYFCYIHPHMVGTVVVEAATGGNSTQ